MSRQLPAPSPLYSGERAGARGDEWRCTTRRMTPHLTLSPEYRGEGTGGPSARIWSLTFGDVYLFIRGIAAFQHVAPERGHATPGFLIGRFQWRVDVALGREEQRHVGKLRSHRQMVRINLDIVARRITGNRQRFGGR